MTQATDDGMTKETQKERCLDAYYYGFNPTGNDAIDAILEAVADAGSSYHHTEDWNERQNGKPTVVEVIQQAANDAASQLAAVTAERDRLVKAWEFIQADKHPVHCDSHDHEECDERYCGIVQMRKAIQALTPKEPTWPSQPKRN